MTNTVTDPESHTNNALVDFLTDSFYLSHTVNILVQAFQQVQGSIDSCGSCALCIVESKIPSFAAIIAMVDPKISIIEDLQSGLLICLVENTFLCK